jgi:hypothetical protein
MIKEAFNNTKKKHYFPKKRFFKNFIKHCVNDSRAHELHPASTRVWYPGNMNLFITL